jgi:hypothetical protein
MRVYHVLGILLVGWAAGRLPDLLRAMPVARLSPAQPGAAGPQAAPDALGPADAAALAAAVASQVAGETVARLVAAGWGPGEAGHVAQAPPPSQRIEIVALPAAPPLAPAAIPDAAGFVLQPMAAPSPVAPGPGDPAVAATPGPTPQENQAKARALATQGYAALRRGERAEAARDLSAAIALAPDAPEAKAWSADLKAVTRHLSAGFYALLRDSGGGDPLAAAPILGSSQTGAYVGYTFNPLGRRRISAFGRLTTGSNVTGAIDPETSEAALGVRVDPLPRVPVHVAIERRFALGSWAVNAWAARLAGGTQGRVKVGRLPLDWDAYGEGGVVDFSAPQPYVGAQARALVPVISFGRMHLDGGAGLWGGAQDGFVTSYRFDMGPALRLRFDRSPISAELDYRVRLIGNAEPGSGLALTLAGQF